jgi:hypothetical protein
MSVKLQNDAACSLETVAGSGSACQITSKSMQGHVFFLVFVLQTGLHATPAQLLFNLITQTRQARQLEAACASD